MIPICFMEKTGLKVPVFAVGELCNSVSGRYVAALVMWRPVSILGEFQPLTSGDAT
jgi:hypothetical protein